MYCNDQSGKWRCFSFGEMSEKVLIKKRYDRVFKLNCLYFRRRLNLPRSFIILSISIRIDRLCHVHYLQ